MTTASVGAGRGEVQDGSSCMHLQGSLVWGKDALADAREHTWDEVSSLTAEVLSLMLPQQNFLLEGCKYFLLYFLLFPIRRAGELQHEAIKR